MNTGLLRRFLEPIEPKGNSWGWGEAGGHVVWKGNGLVRDLGAVLIRRLMDAEKSGESTRPLSGAFPVTLADLAAFLRGEVDEKKLEDLIWGLSLVEGRDQPVAPDPPPEDTELPRAYALLKLTLLPGRLGWSGRKPRLRIHRPVRTDAAIGFEIKPEPAMLGRLRAGDVPGACEIAARRLRASGFSVIGGLRADGACREIEWSAGGASADRLLGALLFPIPDDAVDQLADLVLRRPSPETPL